MALDGAGRHILTLDLSSRARNALLRAGIRTLDDLSAMDPRDLGDLRGVGAATLTEIRSAVEARRAPIAAGQIVELTFHKATVVDVVKGCDGQTFLRVETASEDVLIVDVTDPTVTLTTAGGAL